MISSLQLWINQILFYMYTMMYTSTRTLCYNTTNKCTSPHRYHHQDYTFIIYRTIAQSIVLFLTCIFVVGCCGYTTPCTTKTYETDWTVTRYIWSNVVKMLLLHIIYIRRHILFSLSRYKIETISRQVYINCNTILLLYEWTKNRNNMYSYYLTILYYTHMNRQQFSLSYIPSDEHTVRDK